jgi:hypothetical protein
MRHAGRQLKLALSLPCCFASLLLMALLFLPKESSAQFSGRVNGNAACTNPNPNPNPNPAAFAATGDFNGDCKSDILWQNSGTGQVYMWLMNGTSILSNQSPGSSTSDWVIQGVGDFNGDGMADILWRNSTTGQVYIWLMNGTTITSQTSLGSPTSDWSIQGVGDFNGDGKSDILWRNSTTGQVYIWLMNGTTITSNQSPGSPTTDWNIQGVGDFNGDGMADIVWRNSTTGQVYIWLMSGTTVTSNQSPGSPTAVWSIQGVGDFDGNGMSDILWRNSTTGQVYIWFMDGTTITSSQSPGSPTAESSTQCCVGVGNGWSILGVGDYNGDGKADIVWRQLTTGQVYVWLMDGATVATNQNFGSPAPIWQIATLSPYGCSNEILCNILYASNNMRASGPFGAGNPAPSATAGGPLLPFTWDVGAASVAQNWAAQCNGLTHNPNRDGGENIYIAGSTTTPVTITGTDAVSSWSAESSNYTYSSNSCAADQECGHYTQLAWRTTNAVGCAVQQCTTNSPFGASFPDYALVVCDYTPAGNWSGVQPY